MKSHAYAQVSDDGGRSLVPRLAGMASLPKPDIEAPSPPSVLQGQVVAAAFLSEAQHRCGRAKQAFAWCLGCKKVQ